MSEFLDTDAGRFAARAKAFLTGARVLKNAMASEGRIVFAPTVHLAAHGLELILKASLLLNGVNNVRAHGHRINEMWNLAETEPVRGHVYANAGAAYNDALSEGGHPGLTGDEDAVKLIGEYVGKLGELHAMGEHPIRYPSEVEYMAPRVPLLVEALYLTADDFVKRPRDFQLANFHGNLDATCT